MAWTGQDWPALGCTGRDASVSKCRQCADTYHQPSTREMQHQLELGCGSQGQNVVKAEDACVDWALNPKLSRHSKVVLYLPPPLDDDGGWGVTLTRNK